MAEKSKPNQSVAIEKADDTIRPITLEFLYDVASRSYKEWSELDESIWRTMPFIAALGGLAFTIFRLVPQRLSFSGLDWDLVASFCYVSSMMAFLLAFAYFIVLALPNEFEQPSNSQKVRDHAASLSEWYVASKTKDSLIDESVRNDMRRLLIDQLSNAVEHNRPIIERRLTARSRTILFLISGFAFIILSESAMFLSTTN